MQYFKDRNQAGIELSKRLDRYRDSFTVVVALSPGGVVTAVPIANRLHLPLGLLAVREIKLPWDRSPVMGSVDQSGIFSENESLGKPFLEEFNSEYHNYIDQEKITAVHEINLMHVSNVLRYDHLKDRNIIFVSDGLADIRAVDEMVSYLKPVHYQKLIAALPVATMEVIDKLHISVDEIHCLDVKANYISTNHYYENNELPEYEELMNTLVAFDTMA